MRTPPRIPIAALAAFLMALPAASPAAALVGPGHVTVPLSARPTVRDVAPFAPNAGAALPDGGTVLAGVTRRGNLMLMALRRDGSLDEAFGLKGVVLPASRRAATIPVVRVLRRPDGELLVVYARPDGELVVAGLTAAGALDPSYGAGGVAASGVRGGDAALALDGSVVLTGEAGRAPGATGWAVARLTPAGARDAAFGTVRLPSAAIGVAIAAFSDGSLAVAGASAGAGRLARLTPTGALDPLFNGGAPVAVGLPAGVSAHADGSVDLLVAAQTEGYVAGFARDGTPDESFGTGGRIAVGADHPVMAVAPDGSEVVITDSSATLITLDGAGATVGGRDAGFLGAPADLLPAGPAEPARYVRGRPVARPDGSVLVPGAVAVMGRGRLHEEEAAYSLSRELGVDRAFGGKATRPKVSATLPRQRVGSRVVVRVTASGPGAVLVRLSVGGRRVAQTAAPAFAAGHLVVTVPVGAAARRALARGRVTATVELRDLLRGSAQTRATNTVTLRAPGR